MQSCFDVWKNQRNVIYQINTLKKIYMIILITTEKKIIK